MGTIIRHNGYSRRTKYDAVQHKYDVTGSKAPLQGFAEVLEIKNPPAGRKNFVIDIHWDGHGLTYFEFENLSAVATAYEIMLPLFKTERMGKVIDTILKDPKVCNHSAAETPWFYET